MDERGVAVVATGSHERVETNENLLFKKVTFTPATSHVCRADLPLANWPNVPSLRAFQLCSFSPIHPWHQTPALVGVPTFWHGCGRGTSSCNLLRKSQVHRMPISWPP
eukprot:scaffold5420_cov27-Tisochrysis_lutea.AAC.5